MANEVVKYHNILSTIPFTNFNYAELNILITLLSIVKDRGEEKICIDFKTLKELSGSTEKHNDRFANIIRQTNKKLLQLNIMLYDDKQKGTTVQLALFNTFITSEENQTLEVSVNKDFVFILNLLLKNFTTFELKEYVSLKSTYSKECYRQLKRFKDTGWWSVTIEDFKMLLDIPKSYNASKINDKVLHYINQELPQYFDGLKIAKRYSQRKGNPVIGYDFTFKIQKSQNENKSSILCPACGKPLIQRSINGKNCWCHGDGYLPDAECSKIYNSVSDIKGYKEHPTRDDSNFQSDTDNEGNFMGMPEEMRKRFGL